MREIKFRVWHENSKNYKYISIESFNFGSFTGLVDDSVENDTAIWEQFTGLKDKNGKEIYEGDILKRKDFIFHDGDFVFLPVEYKYAEWELGMRRLNDVYKSCEVVGNIHENADL